MYQRTIKASVELEGPTLWTKGWTGLRISPAEANRGIVFRRTDTRRALVFPVSVEHAELRSHLVVLHSHGAELAFVEHLLAALWGMGIDNACVDVDGSEFPFFDGSALAYVVAIRKVGLEEQGLERRMLRPCGSWVLVLGTRMLYIRPAARPGISYIFRCRGLKLRRFNDIEKVFPTEIAPARTFAVGGFPEFSYPFKIRSVGEFSFPFPPRFSDEMLRHKVLDMVGDLALLGSRMAVHIWAFGTGHLETHKAIKLLLKEVLDEDVGYRCYSSQAASPLSLPDGR